MARERKEWWRRSMTIFSGETRDPGKLREDINEYARERREETDRYAEEFHEDVERVRERLFGKRVR